MKSINPDIVLKPVKEYVLMAVGMLMYSFGWIGCILPAGGVGGGAAGLSLVLCNALSTAGIDLQIGTMVFIINAVLLLVAGFIVGWNFGLKTIFCVVIISLGMNFWQEVLPDGNFLGVDNLLAIVMGGILAGAGIALCFSQGGSTGGTDILAMILKRRTTLEIGRALLLVDIGIVTIAAFLYGPRVGLYCVLGLFAKTLVVDKAIESIHLRKVCTVICSEPLKVEEFIVKHLNRTATISRGYGAFSGKCVTVIMSVLSRREAVQLRRYAREIDPGAFITIVDSSEIVGKGFRGTN